MVVLGPRKTEELDKTSPVQLVACVYYCTCQHLQ